VLFKVTAAASGRHAGRGLI